MFPVAAVNVLLRAVDDEVAERIVALLDVLIGGGREVVHFVLDRVGKNGPVRSLEVPACLWQGWGRLDERWVVYDGWTVLGARETVPYSPSRSWRENVSVAAYEC